MARAFVETTVLTDVLLKRGSDVGLKASAALSRFEVTELPVYAIKEFQSGPLKNFAWFHNKLVTTRSFAISLSALQKMAMTPRRYTAATALEALREAAQGYAAIPIGKLVEKYGISAKADTVLCDMFRLSIKANMVRAWGKRRTICTSVVNPLSCYSEGSKLRQDADLLIVDSSPCRGAVECCLATQLRARQHESRTLRDAVLIQSKKAENERRARTLRSLYRTPKRTITIEMCRDLGDAYFAMFAPADSVILSTNLKDIEPLAASLGKSVERP